MGQATPGLEERGSALPGCGLVVMSDTDEQINVFRHWFGAGRGGANLFWTCFASVSGLAGTKSEICSEQLRPTRARPETISNASQKTKPFSGQLRRFYETVNHNHVTGHSKRNVGHDAWRNLAPSLSKCGASAGL